MSDEIEGLETAAAASIRSEMLTGEEEQRYVRRFLAILRAARLSDQYPDSRRLSAHIHAMGPEVHRGEYDGLEINVDSGLPSYKEFTRVQTDVSIAADQLAKLGSRQSLAKKAASSSHDIHKQQLAKYDYYDEVADVPLAPLGAMDVALRRVEPSKNRAHFRIVFDKLDASGIFVRYAIELTQRAGIWDTAAVELDEDTASYTDEFKSMIYKFSSMDAEFTYAKLATLSGVEVQRVSRGTVGPIYFGRFDPPEPFDGLLEGEPDAFVAHFAIDTAAQDVREHRNNDPFGELFETEMSRKMRGTYAKAREQFGYCVYRDRKFVVSQGLQRRLSEICEEMGTKNIVYSV